MDTFSALMHGFAVATTIGNLGWCFLGVVLGTAIGVLPGIGPALTVALLLPVTYGMEPASAFIMFAGIYYGAMYGGSTTSILLNTPGESASIVTALDGHAMARQGRGAQALATAAIGSFVAGTIATAALTFVAPLMVKLALLFGLDGIDVVVVAVGLFAVGETLFTLARHRYENEEIYALKDSKWMSREDWRRSWKPWLRGTALGFPIGALPAGGSEIPTFLSYLTEKRLSKHPEEFGKGAIEAVAGPEAANNASAAGVLAPLLALGLPTSATAAIMLAAFQQYGIQPGPTLFDKEPELVWGLIASLYIGNLMLLVLNLPLAGVWVKILAVPRPWLYAGILLFATMGAYTLNNNITDVVLLWIIGIIGFGMHCYDIPIAPCIVGLILGPLAEQQFRRALTISQGDATVFFTEPLSLSLLVIAAALVVLPMILRQRRKP